MVRWSGRPRLLSWSRGLQIQYFSRRAHKSSMNPINQQAKSAFLQVFDQFSGCLLGRLTGRLSVFIVFVTCFYKTAYVFLVSSPPGVLLLTCKTDLVTKKTSDWTAGFAVHVTSVHPGRVTVFKSCQFSSRVNFNTHPRN